MKLHHAALLLAATLPLSACTTYYQIKDPQSGTLYYSTEVDEGNSSVKFNDAKSGSRVTLTNAEVKEIDSDTYNAGVGKK